MEDEFLGCPHCPYNMALTNDEEINRIHGSHHDIVTYRRFYKCPTCEHAEERVVTPPIDFEPPDPKSPSRFDT